MWWVSKPIYSSAYTLRSGDGEVGDDATSYVPGTVMQLHLRVNQYDMKYIGLLLYAEDGDGRMVGEMNPNDDKFATPFRGVDPGCSGAVTHNSATIKPFHAIFHFTTPPRGTGKIYFRCLIKTGPANTGAFYYPNQSGDLSLLEDTTVIVKPKLSITAVGQSCSEYCQATNQGVCNADRMEVVMNDFQYRVLEQNVCRLPTMCGETMATGSDGFCYNSCSDTNLAPSNICDMKSTLESNGKMFCSCSLGDGYSTITNSSPSTSRPNLLWVVLSSILALLHQGHQVHGHGGGGLVSLKSSTLLAAVVILGLAVPALGHNWYVYGLIRLLEGCFSLSAIIIIILYYNPQG
jgi:hypothetical protein